MSVWQKQKNWWNEVLWKPKKALSLDQLKFQHHMLLKNPVVTDHNKQLLVETFRSIAEILIWGDQNDSRVFDFFLEKNMQAFFLKILVQKCGHYVCVQLLQTLNILFENIRNETSIYYLLSNNHINSIIVLKLDFSDEEVLAYYISFLKTLSFHLNKHTIHFFYNEHLRDFPLYTEAIKFFKHSESMVRIAVRTLTLNVYKVDDQATLEYICNNSAAPYFSNLAWFIGNHVIELDECLISQAHHLNRGRLEQLVAEHLDHLHYISDIFSLDIQCLNDILSDHFLNRLLIPLYICSLVDEPLEDSEEKSPRISSTISLFLLSQVFLILTHPSLVTPLAYLIFTGDTSLSLPPSLQQGHKRGSSYNGICAFVQPESSLETTLVRQSSQAHANPISMARGGAGASWGGGRGQNSLSSASVGSIDGYVDTVVDDQYVVIEASPSTSGSNGSHSPHGAASQSTSPHSPNSQRPGSSSSYRPKKTTPSSLSRHKNSKPSSESASHGIPIVDSQFLTALMTSLNIQHDDSRCLFALSIIYAMLKNTGINQKLLEAFSLKLKPKQSDEQGSPPQYNSELVALLLSILDNCTTTSNSIRLITLRLTIMLLWELLGGGQSSPPSKAERAGGGGEGGGASPVLQDHHIALVENIYESARLKLRMFYKGPQDEVFLDMFEDEYQKEKSFKLKVSFLMMDESMLLPPTNTPLTGIDFTRRLPCGENEKARKAMRVFFAIRKLSQQMLGEEEKDLPLTKTENSLKIGDVMDTENCDLLSCQLVVNEKTTQHFLVFKDTEFILVDPHKTKLGAGIVHFIAFLQDLDISADPANTHALYVMVLSRNSTQKRPVLSGKFIFEDHLRCMAAKSVFQRAKEQLHHSKMSRIAKMLHLPVPDSPSAVPVSSQQHPSDATPPSVMSATPTMPITHLPPPAATLAPGGAPFSPNQRYSSSVLHRFNDAMSPTTPTSDISTHSQNIELSAIQEGEQKRQSLLFGEEAPDFGVPVRLALPAPLPHIKPTDEREVTPTPLLTVLGPGYPHTKSSDGVKGAGFNPFLTTEGRTMGDGEEDMSSRDHSLTPEPSMFQGGVASGDDEEGLTANGGLFGFSDISNSGMGIGVEVSDWKLDTDRSLFGPRSPSTISDGYEGGLRSPCSEGSESEKVCPLGLELGRGGMSPTEHAQLEQIAATETEQMEHKKLVKKELEFEGTDQLTEHAQTAASPKGSPKSQKEDSSHSRKEYRPIFDDDDDNVAVMEECNRSKVFMEKLNKAQVMERNDQDKDHEGEQGGDQDRGGGGGEQDRSQVGGDQEEGGDQDGQHVIGGDQDRGHVTEGDHVGGDQERVHEGGDQDRVCEGDEEDQRDSTHISDGAKISMNIGTADIGSETVGNSSEAVVILSSSSADQSSLHLPLAPCIDNSNSAPLEHPRANTEDSIVSDSSDLECVDGASSKQLSTHPSETSATAVSHISLPQAASLEDSSESHVTSTSELADDHVTSTGDLARTGTTSHVTETTDHVTVSTDHVTNADSSTENETT